MQAAESCGLESVAKTFIRKNSFQFFLNALSKETLLPADVIKILFI
jgi:hypothetical protein